MNVPHNQMINEQFYKMKHNFSQKEETIVSKRKGRISTNPRKKQNYTEMSLIYLLIKYHLKLIYLRKIRISHHLQHFVL